MLTFCALGCIATYILAGDLYAMLNKIADILEEHHG